MDILLLFAGFVLLLAFGLLLLDHAISRLLHNMRKVRAPKQREEA